jgi:hypothetical protein
VAILTVVGQTFLHVVCTPNKSTSVLSTHLGTPASVP